MYQIGATVIHPEYGWGKFIEVFGKKTRIAVVEFPDRGKRCFTLPSERLVSLDTVRRSGWKSFFNPEN